MLLNLDSISWIMPDDHNKGQYEVECYSSHISVDEYDYQRILAALGIR